MSRTSAQWGRLAVGACFLIAFAVVTAASELAAAAEPETGADTTKVGRRLGAKLVDVSKVPLRTQGRFIVDKFGDRVKWACVNIMGAESKTMVMGGLEVRPVEEIAERVVELGFNCIRLPVSAQASMENLLVEDEFVEANPRLKGKRFLEVLDNTIDAFTSRGLMVIFDVHVLRKGWCCFPGQDEGLWYVDGFTEEMWLDNLYNMTTHYKKNPMVVAISIKNEVHDYGSTYLSWGDGNPKTDWHMASTKAGNRVLEANPDMLVVVMGVMAGMMLSPVRHLPVKLNVPDRVVYETHNYVEYVVTNFLIRLFDSPESMKGLVYIASFVVLLILMKLLWDWRESGAPVPSIARVLLPVGWWLFGIGIMHCVWIIVIYFVWSIKGGMWGARNLALPWLFGKATLGLSVVGVIVLVLGRYLQHRPLADSSRSPILLQTDDYGSSDDEKGSLVDRDRPQPLRWKSKSQLNGAVACVMLLLQGFHLVWSIDYWMSYEWTASWFDMWFGFILEEGRHYTAPVWMGEFGYANEGIYWKHFMRYLSDNDVDFAYWALNGKKYGEGYINDKTGDFIYWAGCNTDVRPMQGTDCSDTLGSWGYEGRDMIYDLMIFEDRPNACIYDAPTKGTCDRYCKSIGRQCLKASPSDGTCGLKAALEPINVTGCFEPLESQLCVCTRQLWVWDDETFGLLARDYRTANAAWRIRDLQALAESPSKWYPKDIGCLGDYNGHVCVDY